jgi:4-carboxymuconolactone decarboxylase
MASTNRTHEERRAAAAGVLSRFRAGDVDVERWFASIEGRRGALGSFAVDFVMGELWTRPQLSPRDRSLIVIAFLVTMGNELELTQHTEIGVNHGLTRDEVDEILLTVAVYAGWPIVMTASRVVESVYCKIDGTERQPPKQPAARKTDEERRSDAASVLHTMSGGATDADPTAVRDAQVARLGDIGELGYDWCFGEVWPRGELSRRDRSLVVVAVLAFLAKEPELALHVAAAVQHGATREELREVMVTLVIYGGFPRAVDARRVAEATFAKLDARAR